MTAFVVFLVLFSATVVGWLLLPRSTEARSILMMLIWVNVLLMLGGLAFEVRRRPYSLHQMHLLALFLFMGAASIFQYSRGYLGVARAIGPLQGPLLVAVVAITLWVVGYLVSYELTRRLGRPARGPLTGFLNRRATPFRVFLFLGVALLTLVYLAAIGLGQAETRMAASETMSEYAAQTGTAAFGLGYFLVHQLLLRALSPVAFLAGLLVLFRYPGSRNPAFVSAVAAVGLGTLLINNPFAASRMWLATALIAFSAPLVLRRLRTGWALVLITFTGIALLPALHETRYMRTFEEFIEFFRLSSPLVYLSTNSDVDSLGMLALVQRWIEIHGHTWGMQILGGLLFWFPRTFWSDKPIETGAMVTGDLGFEFTNLAPPIVAEALVDFGLLGILPLSALLGFLFARLDRAYWDSEGGPGLRVIDCVYPFWLGCTVFLTRGGWFASLTFTSVFTVWILLLGIGAPRVARAAAPSKPPRPESPTRAAGPLPEGRVHV